jgi:hypothetical protein
MTFLEAVGREEGFLVEGTRPQRNNNPGDIEYGKFAIAHGAIKGDPRFAVFPDIETGYKAMQALFSAPSYNNLTVREALNKWAPPVENATDIYVDHICKWVGCEPDDLVAPLVAVGVATI